MKWISDNRNNHEFINKGIRLARVWKRHDGEWQIAIDLPLAKLPYHRHETLAVAKRKIEEIVTEWFTLMGSK